MLSSVLILLFVSNISCFLAKRQILVTKLDRFTVRVRTLLMSSSAWHRRRVNNIFWRIYYNNKISRVSYPQHVSNKKECYPLYWFCYLTLTIFQNIKLFVTVVVFFGRNACRVRALVMSSIAWYQRRVDNILFTTSLEKIMLSTSRYK